MRIEHKYIRNRRFRCKSWKRIRNQSHPFKTMMPYNFIGSNCWRTFDEQVKSHFELIELQARAIDKGSKKNWNHAPADFRRELNKQRKAKERCVLARIRNGDYDCEIPHFKKDANWLYF